MDVRTIGASGQISLGKKYAGKTVIVEQVEDEVWTIRGAMVIPKDEMWMHQEPAKSKIDRAIAWADTHPTKAVSFDEAERTLRAARRKASRVNK